MALDNGGSVPPNGSQGEGRWDTLRPTHRTLEAPTRYRDGGGNDVSAATPDIASTSGS